jgi:antitoxin PrlF
MHCTTMTQKGQITLPVDFRNNLHLMPGDSLKCRQVGDEIIVKKVRKPTLMDLSGCRPKPKRSFTIEEMDAAVGKALGKKYAK